MELMARQQQNIIQTIKDYGRQLFGFIRSRVATEEDAEDILQDVWFQLSLVPEMEAIDSISGWLYRVARNKIIDRSRKKNTRSLEEITYGDEEGNFNIPDIILSESFSPESKHLRQVFWEELFEALKELPVKQRNVFIRNELEDLTLQQIADMEGENIKTIISRKRYAVRHLRNRLENLYIEIFN